MVENSVEGDRMSREREYQGRECQRRENVKGERMSRERECHGRENVKGASRVAVGENSFEGERIQWRENVKGENVKCAEHSSSGREWCQGRD